MLSIERKRPIILEHSLQQSVGLCVCLSVECIVAKRLIGYGCSLDGRSDEAIVGFGDQSMGGGNLGG